MINRTQRAPRQLVYPSDDGAPSEWGGLIPLADWDMSNAVVFDDSGTARVSEVPDAGSSGVPLLAPSGAEPEYVSSSAYAGLPAARFPANDTRRFTFAHPGFGENEVSIYLVCHSNGEVGKNAYMFAATNASCGFYRAGGANWHSWMKDILATGPNSNNDASQKSAVLLGVDPTVGQFMYVNSTTAEGTDTVDTTSIAVGGLIGNYASPSGAFSAAGDIARVLVFGGSHYEQSVRSTIMNALGAKYGITIA